jgi:hypothetical protein
LWKSPERGMPTPVDNYKLRFRSLPALGLTEDRCAGNNL